MQVAQVGQHAVGIGHILVDIVEVAEQQLSPTIELIKRFRRTSHSAERLMEQADRLNRVGNLQVALLTEQIADGDVGWTPYRTLCLAG